MTTRLGRRTHLEEEDAATLKLGSEFNNAGCLLISEVKILLKEKEGKPGVDSPYVFPVRSGWSSYRSGVQGLQQGSRICEHVQQV